MPGFNFPCIHLSVSKASAVVNFLSTLVFAWAVLTGITINTSTALESCIGKQDFSRIARVRSSNNELQYVKVLQSYDGMPTLVVPVATAGTPLPIVFEKANKISGKGDEQAAFRISKDERATKICPPVDLSQTQIDAETGVVVAAGLNYAAHAEEAGGGSTFLFPKPAAPSAAYQALSPPPEVVLLDYEIELAFVLLQDIHLNQLPSEDQFLENSAFFMANDISDREPIILNKALMGPGTGFVNGKGQAGFLPVGPWMVRGSELYQAIEHCGKKGLSLSLSIDEGEGPKLRQQANTEAMILSPYELLKKIASEVEEKGPRTEMPFNKDDSVRFYPLVVSSNNFTLTAGSIVLTGTPEGVALQAPSNIFGILFRGLLHLRSPLGQFAEEERIRVQTGETGGYLKPGDVIHAQIDGLGKQLLTVKTFGEYTSANQCQ